MSAPTLARSAYPAPVADLLPRARTLVAELGHVPSQNRIKAEFKVGTGKARQLRGALLADQEPTPYAPLPVDSGAAEAIISGNELPLVAPVAEPVMPTPAESAAQPSAVAEVPGAAGHRVRSWPVLLLALPAFVAIWSGWVGLGGLTGFGIVHPLPGIADRLSLNTAITLPIGVETYAAYALRIWLSPGVAGPARRFAKWSAIGSLMLGAAGQMAYHLMAAAHITHAPSVITILVASLPVAVLGMGAALAHLIRNTH